MLDHLPTPVEIGVTIHGPISPKPFLPEFEIKIEILLKF
jgi:hypothetical protein